ncbi:ABC transporter ATP-binding protein [Desulfonema ishimotonii]|uniref:ABC transporter ATP-binding protein n=1 Tax=Desulfonema ishimotonii TaxID=45657 RepID=A0A401FXK0_9BACT|nr:ABC transporter ATP-binding protein [Desulfonema ishimotonii]GBC61676.1 ABC transporter ATP-binding protein [Desulfonema ishimotonii]
MLRLVNIHSAYGLVRVLKNVSLHVDGGEIVTLIGANGAGKTTLLRAISGLQPVQEGRIIFDGRDIANTRAEKLVRFGIAQAPEGRQIFRPMTVMENLELGGYLVCRLHGRKQLRRAIGEMFDMFPILRERQDQFAGTLSGGEQQMLAIAMTLMNKPRLLLLDEPSMGLAPLIVREIFEIISRLRKDEGLTVLLVEQNANAALRIADRGYVMETGKIIIQDRADALLENPEVRRAYLGRDKREIWE